MDPYNSITSRRSLSFKDKGLQFGRNLFNKEKAGNEDVASSPRPGDLLRLAGFGGEISLNDGQIVTLQTLVAISVSGVVLCTFPKSQRAVIHGQAALVRDAHQELTNSGYGVYGLSRDKPPDSDNARERCALPFKLICDEKGTLTSALGLERNNRETARNVTVIGKDGRIIASSSAGSAATLQTVAPLVHAIGMLERTPTQEYTTEGYFAVSPISPSTPASQRGEPANYFDEAYISSSVASLHSYLEQMDSPTLTPHPPKVGSAARRPGLKPRSQSGLVLGKARQRNDNQGTCSLCDCERVLSETCECETHEHVDRLKKRHSVQGAFNASRSP